jgi:hypothetical protein
MRGQGPVADLIRTRFTVAIRRLGLNQPREGVDVTQFRVPPKAGDQLDLWGGAPP